MSNEDRTRWNARYAEGAFEDRLHPSSVLVDWLSDLPSGLALDVACGAGRNAIYLASNGFTVHAIDISRVAIERGAERARALGLANIQFYEHDLEEHLPTIDRYDLIVMIRYVNAKLLRLLTDRLNPGGKLLVEEHLVWKDPVVGPTRARFRVEPGELGAALHDLTIEREFEGLIRDPDGVDAAVARVLAVRDR